MRVGRLALFVCLFVSQLVSAAYGADDLSTAELTIPGVGDAVVVYPVEWDQQVVQPRKDLPPTLKLRSKGSGLPVSLQITLLPDKQARLQTEKDLARAVLNLGEKFAEGSVEGRTQLVRLPSSADKGLFASYTDARWSKTAPPKGEYRHVTVGVRSFGDAVASFTLLSNDLDGEGHQLGLLVMANGIHRLPPPASAP